MKLLNEIPNLGFGTWNLTGTAGRKAMEYALEVGYRYIDTADWYRNHDIVGQSIKSSGVSRSDIFLVTKVYPPLDQERIKSAAYRFLEELRTDYIDLLLIHWPDGTPVIEPLTALQALKDEGIIRRIGVSNFDKSDINEALETGISFVNNQIKIHPGHVPTDLINHCRSNGISVTAYSPLGKSRSIRNEVVTKIAGKHDLGAAQVILSWLMSKDLIVIPKATSERHVSANWESQNVQLGEEDLKLLDNI